MKCPHAIGFLALGLAFAALPRVAPGLFVGAGARELWIAFMSWVQFAIGGCWLLGRALSALADAMRYEYVPSAAEPVVAAPAPFAPEPVLAFAGLGEFIAAGCILIPDTLLGELSAVRSAA